jgi:hypothetical protein
MTEVKHMSQPEIVSQQAHEALENWIVSCTRNGKVARNTIAVGIIVLDHMRQEIPVTREQVLSPGGEIKGARSGLRTTLEKYGIPKNYLKEATTRQAHQDGQRLLEALKWGEILQPLVAPEREIILTELTNRLKTFASEWLNRQNLKLELDRRESPTRWIGSIIDSARSQSGGVVEQHLVGAKLARRHQDIDIPNHPAHAADWQTARSGDFTINKTVYHITATPSRGVIEKCAANIRSGLHPVLLVPSVQEYRAKALAQEEDIDKGISIISIEAFVALNIIEIANDSNKDFFRVFEEIVETYNIRLAEVETDLSLRIELK